MDTNITDVFLTCLLRKPSNFLQYNISVGSNEMRQLFRSGKLGLTINWRKLFNVNSEVRIYFNVAHSENVFGFKTATIFITDKYMYILVVSCALVEFDVIHDECIIESIVN